MDSLFSADPEPTNLEDFVTEYNATRQDLIDAGLRVATEDEWAAVLARSAEIERRSDSRPQTRPAR